MILALCASALFAASLAASTMPGLQPPGPQAAPKDKLAAVRGSVTATGSKKPLRRVQIRVSGATLNQPRVVNTDVEGRYEIADLPFGRYEVRASRGGYLPMSYGQRFPLEAGKPLELSRQNNDAVVNFVLPKVGSISGHISDEIGDPIAGVAVWATALQYLGGRRRLVPIGTGVRTDESGQYRLGSLAPGDYLVTAITQEKWTVLKPTVQVLGFATTHYPGVTSVTEAQRVRLILSQEAVNIDFALVPGRAAQISGTALSGSGQPLQGDVILMQEMRGQAFSSAAMITSSRIRDDGSWILTGVPPGDYSLEARGAAGSPNAAEFGVSTVSVRGDDIEGQVISAGRGGTVSGSVVTDRGVSLAQGFVGLRVTARATMENGSIRSAANDSGLVAEDGTFQLTKAHPASLLRLTGLPTEWSVKSIEVDGREMTDSGLGVKEGGTLERVLITITNRLTTIRGRVMMSDSRVPADGTVVVFSADATRWGEGSRFVQSARPDQMGQFELRGMPPAEYLAVALEYLPEGQLSDPDFLETLRVGAQAFSLKEGESRVLTLSIGHRRASRPEVHAK
jgi:predicted aconitase with swiveling domain